VPVFGEAAADYRSLKLGERIRAYRRQRGWTLRDLSIQLSTSIAALSAIENDRAVLDLERLVAISDVLGVRPDALFPKTSSCHFYVQRQALLEQVPPVTVKVRNQAQGWPAYASFEEQRKGTLAPGMLADVVVLSRDIFAEPPAKPGDVVVDVTVFDGKVVYRR
jgi:transcriptional regulator with XRE-family HTH domain